MLGTILELLVTVEMLDVIFMEAAVVAKSVLFTQFGENMLYDKN